MIWAIEYCTYDIQTKTIFTILLRGLQNGYVSKKLYVGFFTYYVAFYVPHIICYKIK